MAEFNGGNRHGLAGVSEHSNYDLIVAVYYSSIKSTATMTDHCGHIPGQKGPLDMTNCTHCSYVSHPFIILHIWHMH